MRTMRTATLGIFLWSALVCSIARASTPCADFHFPDSGFAAIEQDYKPALLYVWAGDDSRKHGVAFLIDVAAQYYLTARHVVEPSISNPSLAIQGMDPQQNKLTLKLVADDSTLDVALLKGQRSALTDGMRPYELFLATLASEDVTFSGLAYADPYHLLSAPPKEDRFEYNEDGSEIYLRVNTDEGDSGAPVYTKKGLVVGIVRSKQKISQASAVPMNSLADFLTDNAADVPTAGAGWKLYDMLIGRPDRKALMVRLRPANVPGRISNLQLLGVIKAILDQGRLAKMDKEFIYCPLVQAAHDRGLYDVAFRLEVAEAGQLAKPRQESGSLEGKPAPAEESKSTPVDEHKPAPSNRTQGTKHLDSQYAEAMGDILLARAADWDNRGDDLFFRRLSKEAQLKYVDAITGYLHDDKRPLFAFVGQGTSNPGKLKFSVKYGEALSRLGIEDSDVKFGLVVDDSNVSVKTDDHFAALLSKYYQAAAGAEGGRVADPKSVAARNTAAAWSALVSQSSRQKAESWYVLGDAMMKAGQPGDAARSLAGAHKINPADKSVLQKYKLAKSQGRVTSVGFDFKSAIALEHPLTRDDVINFGLKSGM